MMLEIGQYYIYGNKIHCGILQLIDGKTYRYKWGGRGWRSEKYFSKKIGDWHSTLRPTKQTINVKI